MVSVERNNYGPLRELMWNSPTSMLQASMPYLHALRSAHACMSIRYITYSDMHSSNMDSIPDSRGSLSSAMHVGTGSTPEEIRPYAGPDARHPHTSNFHVLSRVIRAEATTLHTVCSLLLFAAGKFHYAGCSSMRRCTWTVCVWQEIWSYAATQQLRHA